MSDYCSFEPPQIEISSFDIEDIIMKNKALYATEMIETYANRYFRKSMIQLLLLLRHQYLSGYLS